MVFYTLSYLCILVFILAAVYEVYRQLTLPIHVRWEIYPVQHETTDKLAHGGSYMEELNWWEKKHGSSLFNEMAGSDSSRNHMQPTGKFNRSSAYHC